MKIINALPLILLLLLFSCDKKKKPSKSQVINNLEHIEHMNLSEMDVYFDSVGYSWIKDDELKDSVIKYHNEVDSSEFYFMKLSNDTLENAAFKTDSLDVFLEALKSLKALGYREIRTTTDTNSIVSTFRKNNLKLASAKIKDKGTKLFYLFILEKAVESPIKDKK